MPFDDKDEAHGCIKSLIQKLNEQYHIVTMFNDHNLTVGYGACSKPTQKITSISVLQKIKYYAIGIYRIYTVTII